MSFAPVLIITLCRYEHFRRCVESLSHCVHADETDLFVALDYPAKDSHWEGYRLIESFLPQINGFKSLTVIRRKENFGAIKNYFASKEEVFQLHDRLIVSEDDNEFSGNFLTFINQALVKYQYDTRIYAVCGYNYPVNMPKSYQHPYYFSKTFSAWGYGTWRDRVRDEHYSVESIGRFLLSPVNVAAAYRMAPQKILSMLVAVKNGLPLYGDGVVSLENIVRDTFCVFPTISKVRNHGHDGSGVHCSNEQNSLFASQQIDSSRSFCCTGEVPLARNEEVSKVLRKYFALSPKQMLLCLILISMALVSAGLRACSFKSERRICQNSQ